MKIDLAKEAKTATAKFIKEEHQLKSSLDKWDESRTKAKYQGEFTTLDTLKEAFDSIKPEDWNAQWGEKKSYDSTKLSKEKTSATKEEILRKLGLYLTSEKFLLTNDRAMNWRNAILDKIVANQLTDDPVVDYYVACLKVQRGPHVLSNDTKSFSHLKENIKAWKDNPLQHSENDRLPEKMFEYPNSPTEKSFSKGTKASPQDEFAVLQQAFDAVSSRDSTTLGKRKSYDYTKLSKEKTSATKEEILESLGLYINSMTDLEKRKKILTNIANNKPTDDPIVDYYVACLKIRRNASFNLGSTRSFSGLQEEIKKWLNLRGLHTQDLPLNLNAPDMFKYKPSILQKWFNKKDDKPPSPSSVVSNSP